MKPRKFGSTLKRKAMGERGHREGFWADRYWGSSRHSWEELGADTWPSCGLWVGGWVGRGTWDSRSLALSILGWPWWGGWGSGRRVGYGGLRGWIFEGKEATGTCQFGLVGRGGHLRKAVVTEGGSWFLANKPWIPPPPSTPAVSFLFILWWEGERGLWK